MTASARVTPTEVRATIDPRLFGGFVEHLGRSIYTGIYEPGHPTADADGFRGDVLDLVRELGATTIRYPGGNFVSGLRWEDTVGPRESRPRRLDLAWHSTETNEVGLHEFALWLDKVGSEPMMAVNLGTRGTLEALDLMEYCLIPSGTARADERARNGHPDPFPIRMWCLGNEMDGPWQLGHRSAEEYGALAMQTAKAMKQLDPDAQLVVCGSSSHDMPTFGSWERTVLERCYDDVDFISCHAYYEPQGDRASFLASGVDMAGFIDEVVEIADAVGRERGSSKRIAISFDEWNVWYLSEFNDHGKIVGLDNWPVAPRLIEDSYSVADAVVVGGLLITLLQHAERVTSASLAQLVNVIAPITTEPGGPAWRQTTFFPFALTSRLGRGEAIALDIDAPTTPTDKYGDVSVVDAVATRDGERGAVFAINRSLTEAVELTVDVAELGWSTVSEAHLLTDDDLDAANTFDQPDRVRPVALDTVVTDGLLTLSLPPASWAAIDLR